MLLTHLFPQSLFKHGLSKKWANHHLHFIPLKVPSCYGDKTRQERSHDGERKTNKKQNMHASLERGTPRWLDGWFEHIKASQTIRWEIWCCWLLWCFAHSLQITLYVWLCRRHLTFGSIVGSKSLSVSALSFKKPITSNTLLERTTVLCGLKITETSQTMLKIFVCALHKMSGLRPLDSGPLQALLAQMW